MDIFVLLDRTGSMQGRWDEAVSSVNAYVEQVRDAAGVDLLTDQDRVTLVAFDHYPDTMDFRVLRNAQPLKAWEPIKINEVSPRGSTPLLDAVVRIAAMAEARASEKTVLVIMTDVPKGPADTSDGMADHWCRASAEIGGARRVSRPNPPGPAVPTCRGSALGPPRCKRGAQAKWDAAITGLGSSDGRSSGIKTKS